MGSVGDRFGRKGVLSIGLVVFGAASFVAALSKTPAQLIGCRVVMGVGGAMIMPATLSILANVFTDARERRRAIAYWSMTSAAGSTIGPVTGGILLRHFWWGSVFLVNVPVVVIALLAGHFLVPTSRNPTASRLDIIGAGLSTAGLSILLYGIIAAPEKGWTSRPTVVTITASVLVLALFVVWELHTDEPMLDVRFFRDMRLTAAASSITIAMVALTGMMFLVAQLLQFVKGYSPLNAALRVSLPILIINVLVMPLTPRIVERVGPKRLVTTGLAVIAIGLGLVSLTTANSSYVSLLGGFVLMATGFSLFLPTATDAIMGTLPREHAGSGSAINQTSRQTGQALGIAIGGSIAASGFRASLAGAAPSSVVTPGLLEQARESIAGSYRIAEGLDAEVRGPFVHLVNTAFVHGFHLSITLSVIAALVGAVVAFIALPGTLPTSEAEPADDAAAAAAATAAAAVLSAEL
jgi:EmrB/QacA subfamily drug resistance transporter